jgi:hypothetical protein
MDPEQPQREPLEPRQEPRPKAEPLIPAELEQRFQRFMASIAIHFDGPM